jgi:hypothetical protein
MLERIARAVKSRAPRPKGGEPMAKGTGMRKETKKPKKSKKKKDDEAK